MDVCAIGALTREAANGSTAAAKKSATGKDEFLKLLVTQMKNQNPLEPVKDAEFLGQLAQFSTLEGMQQLNKSFTDMLALQQLTQGAALIGKTVSYESAGGALATKGVVEGVKIENGGFQLQVGGKTIPLSQVRGIENTK
jgi:flagellar basal-body rod modification protein FlgD